MCFSFSSNVASSLRSGKKGAFENEGGTGTRSPSLIESKRDVFFVNVSQNGRQAERRPVRGPARRETWMGESTQVCCLPA